MIRTADGEKLVEELAIGDFVPTVFGGMRAVRWISHYRYRKHDAGQGWVESVRPVRIARGALGAGLPKVDLFLTRTHSLLIDDVLVPVRHLIDGKTIAVHDPRELDVLEYFHVKLDSHDVLFAAGAPCDSQLVVDEHAINFAAYVRAYGVPASADGPCAPVCAWSRLIEIESRLRSAMSPWYDRRRPLDIIRDRLEEGESLLRLPERAG